MDETTPLIKVSKEGFFGIKNISLTLITILCFLLPVFFVPAQTISFLMGKSILLTVFVFLLFALWLFEVLKNKSFSFTKNLILISSILVPFSYLLSSLFSGSWKANLWGYDFGINSFSVILSFFLLMFLVAHFFSDKKKIIYLYAGFLLSFVVMLFFHIPRLILGPEFLSLGLLNTMTNNLLGSWNELGIFFGLIALLSLLAIFLIKENSVIKIVGYVFLSIALFFTTLVNFVSVWWLLFLLSLILILYNFFIKKSSQSVSLSKKIPIIPMIIVVLALLFIFAKGSVGNFLPTLFNISNTEVRPSVNSTVDVIQSSFIQNSFIGIGPNEFAKQWSFSKPVAINNTQFWNIDFSSGTSFILTTLVGVGLFGFLAWLLFFASILFLGFKLLRVPYRNKFDQYLSWSVFSATVYLWVFSFVYVPNVVILSLSFLFSGLLLSLSYQEKIVSLKTISFSRSGRKSLAVVIISFLFLLSILGIYLFTNKVVASFQAQKSLVVLNSEGNLEKSLELMQKAGKNSNYDLYYRLLSEMSLLQLQTVLNQKDVAKETMMTQFQTVLDNTLAYANIAVNLDKRNYQNWLSLGDVYRSVVSLKVEGAYDKALEAYGNTIALNPYNPFIALSLANLEIANGDLEKSKGYLTTAIQMKNNYSDAYYLLSQIELNAGKPEEAINVIDVLTKMAPNDSQAFLQLGALKYEVGKYEEAVSSLEQSLGLNPYSVDTAYLLGLSYGKVGKREEAIRIFDSLQKSLPNDTSISTILENIKNGHDPLLGLVQQSPTEGNLSEPITDEIGTEVESETETNVEEEKSSSEE